MSASVVTSYASGADSLTHVISLSGKTNGRDLFILFAVGGATPTLPTNWVQEATDSPNAIIKLWRLPAAQNNSGVTNVSIALDNSVALAAVVWQDDVNTGSLIYASFFAQGPNGATPALWGTNLHTFTSSDESFAIYGAKDTGAFDLVSFDQGYVEFADTGVALTTQSRRMWMARKPSTLFTNDGVTATANAAGSPGDAIAGMIAYQTGVTAPAAPSNTVAPAITGVAQTGSTLTCSTGTWTGSPTSYAYQWKRAGANISGATSNTYVAQVADEGQAVKCTVTATNANGSSSADSNTVTPDAILPGADDTFIRVSEAWVAVDRKTSVSGSWVS